MEIRTPVGNQGRMLGKTMISAMNQTLRERERDLEESTTKTSRKIQLAPAKHKANQKNLSQVRHGLVGT